MFPKLGRTLHGSGRPTPFLQVADAHIYQFGLVNPVFTDPLNWTIRKNGEAWALIGDRKKTLIDVLRGRLRVSPPQPGGIYPLLTKTYPSEDPFSLISYASFATRQHVVGGGFYDYTARYGGVRDEDRKTLRQSLLEESDQSVERVEEFTSRLQINHLLDLPLVALSNGQTRRAHIVKELLHQPQLLLLDEPMTGLDVENRPRLLGILQELHHSHKPRIVLGLRRHDRIPDWVTHIALATVDRVELGSTAEMEHRLGAGRHYVSNGTEALPNAETKSGAGKALVEMKDLSVAYQDRQVLKNINWTIREGERWHLKGSNGSGKTTLLSLLTGDHPQSFIQPHLHIFGKSRKSQSTIQIQQQIGHISPEIFNAFPRRMGPQALSVKDAIGTGLHAVFSYRPRTPEEDAQIESLINQMVPDKDVAWMAQPFAALPIGEQALVLLMRALVSNAKLIILDEPFAGMNDVMTETAKRYLREELDDTQAVVFVTHWEEELPWTKPKALALSSGVATES